MGLLGRLSLAIAIAAVVLHASSEAGASIAVSDDGESHESVWRADDIGLYLDKSLDALSGAEEAVGAALAVWEADSRLPRVWPMSGKADSLGYRSGESNRNTIRFDPCGAPQAKGALAVTLVSYDAEPRTILDGDVLINGLYRFGDLRKHGGITSPITSGRPVYDLTDVLVHEIGHWFGLADDPEDPNAIMYPYFKPGDVRNLSLSSGDIEALDALYASAPPRKNSACTIVAPGVGHRSGASAVIAILSLWVLRGARKCGCRSPRAHEL